MSAKQIRINTSIKVKLDNCKACPMHWDDSYDRWPVFCCAIPGMRELANYRLPPPDWCPLRRGKVIIEGEEE